MKLYRYTLAAMLLSTACVARAGVPVIELAPPAAAATVASTTPQLLGQRVPAPAPLAAPSLLQPGSAAGMVVAVRRQPSTGAMVLLALGCLIYLGRRRRQGFAIRPTRNLREQFSHAPAAA